MATMRGFSTRIRAVAKTIPQNADKLVREVVIGATSVVAMGTPVDTGRARGNWQAQLGEAAQGELPAPGSPGAGAQQAIQRAAEVAAAYPGGVEVHITNNLPYIIPLNEGHSKQAPAQFVQTALAYIVGKINKARLLR